MLSINTNYSNLIIQDSLKTASGVLNQAVERLTTGYKVNCAKDNAANHSIITNLTTKLGSYQIAEDNAAKGLDMVISASENLSLIEEKVQRLRNLSVQVSNGTYGKQSIKSMQAEANALTKEIERLYTSAQYNGIKLIDDSPQIPDGVGVTVDLTPKYDGFIQNPVDYTAAEVAEMKKVSSINSINDLEEHKSYSISSIEELLKLRDLANNTSYDVAIAKFKNVEFVLANDIDLSQFSEGEGWIPISVGSHSIFTFNGNGHVITGLKINRPATSTDMGFFGYHGGTIKNLGIEDCHIVGGKFVGALAGSVRGNKEVINCYSTGYVESASYNNPTPNESKGYAGGLIGYVFEGKVSHCYSEANVVGTKGTATNKSDVGGLIGYVQNAKGIYNSFANGNLKGRFVGGLCGVLTGIIENCYTNCNILEANIAGGMLFESNSLAMTNCYSNSDIVATNFAGGLVAIAWTKINMKDCYSNSNINSNASFNGGLIGDFNLSANSTIENCYSYGEINNKNNKYFIGGIIGYINNSSTTAKIEINNTASYSAITTTSNRAGSFIGGFTNNDLGITDGGIIINNNCGALEQGLNMIGGRYTGSPNYDNTGQDVTTMCALVTPLFKQKKETALQIGTLGDSNSQIEFNSKINTKLINELSKIKITDSNAIDLYDNILDNINQKQTSLGVAQNRIESALDEISIQYENLASSRSTMRDADIAKENAKTIQAQILQEASITLMSINENIRKESVLGLLQGLIR